MLIRILSFRKPPWRRNTDDHNNNPRLTICRRIPLLHWLEYPFSVEANIAVASQPLTVWEKSYSPLDTTPMWPQFCLSIVMPLLSASTPWTNSDYQKGQRQGLFANPLKRIPLVYLWETFAGIIDKALWTKLRNHFEGSFIYTLITEIESYSYEHDDEVLPGSGSAFYGEICKNRWNRASLQTVSKQRQARKTKWTRAGRQKASKNALRRNLSSSVAGLVWLQCTLPALTLHVFHRFPQHLLFATQQSGMSLFQPNPLAT